MEQFSAESFYETGKSMGDLNRQFEKVNLIHVADIPRFQKYFEGIALSCGGIGLSGCAETARRAVEKMPTDDRANEVKHYLRALGEQIPDEMRHHLFFNVPPEKAKYYNPAGPLFGSAVDDKFPTANYDISEAGKCVALNRNTAAVCHLMRVLEIGLRALASALSVPFGDKDWQTALNTMQKEWKRLENLKRKPKGWKKDRQFYSECFVEFGYLKDAWRNHAMHALERYDEERSKSIFNHVEAFMRHLATRLKETP
jgi:hypothetical protein